MLAKCQWDEEMKLRILLTCCLLSVTALPAKSAPKTFSGQISDSQCALNVHSKTHSHNEMLEGGHMGKDPSECAQMCVHDMGGAYVLISKGGIYKPDNQNAADAYPGKEVQIEGVLNAKDNSLHVINIKAAK